MSVCVFKPRLAQVFAAKAFLSACLYAMAGPPWMQPRLFHLELEQDTPKPPCFIREKRTELALADKVGERKPARHSSTGLVSDWAAEVYAARKGGERESRTGASVL